MIEEKGRNSKLGRESSK